ncbi:centrosomal protein of 63 kDa isoform X2 [Colius striatus]|uniref:centrosomal protein of 63 kDa isoform X2 n=1 Tax=Colius striatus TaxID=57412 RepID=UPI002B1E8BEE|nr:centrosomal protein of 63 kDa isoform X2 [Colius striatus]
MEALLEGMQRNGQGSGGFLTSCEAELQELMKQIDIMVAHKKAEWEGQTQALESCLNVREQELASARAALQEKYKEVGTLRRQVEDLEKAKQDMVREYEQQLKKFQEELSRLRRSYEKLQKKQLREATKRQEGEEQFEMSRLTRKLETQLDNRKQILESVELASRSEIQHLTSKLERAEDTISANELEVQRLNLRVDNLTEDNRMILEDQQRLQEELRQSKKMIEVLQDEKMELRATLQSQEDFIESSRMYQEQLQKDLDRVTETLCTKELLIRALEERLQEKQLSSPGLELEHLLLQLDVAQKKEQHLESEVTHLENSLVSAKARCVQLSEELDDSIKELQSMEEHQTESQAEIKKLKEQLSQAEQTHNSELEGMRREISVLTQELQQRDVAIASASSNTSDLEQRLRAEVERAERKAVEHRVILVQLETLRLENRQLSEMLEKTECAVPEGKDVPGGALSEDSALELNTLKAENQQLRKDLAEARAKLELPREICQGEPQGTAQHVQDKEPQAGDVQCRTTGEAQHKHDEQAETTEHKPEGTVQHHQGEPQRHEAAEMGTMTSEKGELPSQGCRKNHLESLALGTSLEADTLHQVLDGSKDFSDETSKQSMSNHQRESVLLCPLPTAPVGSIAARYLEEEELRSQHIQECLNAHVEELKKESEKIVRQFGHQE